MDTMVIATPWKEKDTAFYYNQKINCMRASGRAVFDGKEYVFHPETDFGTLDWGAAYGRMTTAGIGAPAMGL